MIVYAKYEADRDKHIVHSIDGDVVSSVSFYHTAKCKHILKVWTQPLEDMGIKSVDKYVDILIKRGFSEVQDETERRSS